MRLARWCGNTSRRQNSDNVSERFIKMRFFSRDSSERLLNPKLVRRQATARQFDRPALDKVQQLGSFRIRTGAESLPASRVCQSEVVYFKMGFRNNNHMKKSHLLKSKPFAGALSGSSTNGSGILPVGRCSRGNETPHSNLDFSSCRRHRRS